MSKRKLLPQQQDLFSHAMETMQWENLHPKAQQQIIDLLSQLLWSLSSHSIIQGGAPHANENNG